MTQEVWLVLASIVVPFLVQAIRLVYKTVFAGELSARAALVVTYIASIAVAAGIYFTDGQLQLPAGGIEIVLPWVVATIGEVLGIATFVYKTFLSGSTSFVRLAFNKKD